MATRSMIGVQHSNGSIKAIYCHFDGYPLGVGINLLKGFNNVENADYLMEGGSIRVLGESLQETWDENTQPNSVEVYEYDNVDQYREDHDGFGHMGTEFLYLQNHIGNWTVWDCNKRECKALEQAVRDAYNLLDSKERAKEYMDYIKEKFESVFAVTSQVQQQPQEESELDERWKANLDAEAEDRYGNHLIDWLQGESRI